MSRWGIRVEEDRKATHTNIDKFINNKKDILYD